MILPTPSNKTTTSTTKQGTSFADDCNATPEVEIRLDKLSLTLPVDADQEKSAMLDVALHAKDAGWGQPVYPSNGYKLNLRMKLSSGPGWVLFSWSPVNKMRAFFRIECNPSKVGPEGIKELLCVEIDLLVDGGLPAFLAKAKVSRMDVALDLVGVSIGQLVAFSDCAVRSAKYDRFGKLETIYLGASKSAAQTRIYDKLAEMTAKSHAAYSPVPVTRVERVVNNAGLLKNLPQKKNPFSTLHLASHGEKPDGIEPHMWRLFCCHSVQHTGAATLAMLPKPLRTKFKKALKASEPTWWDTHELWKQWPALVYDLGLSSGHMPPAKLS